MARPKPKEKKLPVEDLPVEKVFEALKDMPCEFTEDDFREEFDAYKRRLNESRKAV